MAGKKVTEAVLKEVGMWQQRISAAEEYKKKYGESDKWNEYLDCYRSKFESDDIALNIIYANGKTLGPSVYYRNPKITIVPKGDQRTYITAQILENVVNQLIRVTNVKANIKRMILDAYLYGVAGGFLGYDAEFGWDPSLGEGSALVTEDDTEQDSLTRIEYATEVRPGTPWFLRDDPRNWVVPDGTVFGDRVEWFAKRYYRRIEDVQADPRYDNTDELTSVGASKAEPISVFNTSPHQKDMATLLAEQSQGHGESDSKRADEVELWEIHDARRRQWFVISPSITGYVKEPIEDLLQMPNLPFRTISWNEDGAFFWSASDVKHIYWQQVEVNDSLRQLRDHRSVHTLRLLMSRQGLDEKFMTDFKSGTVGTIAFTDKDDVSTLVKEFTPTVPLDLSFLIQQTEQTARQMVGFSKNQMGEFDRSSRRTKGEAQLVQQGSDTRNSERRDIVGDLLVSIGEAYASMVINFWTEERFEQIAGPDGAPVIVTFKGTDLKGTYGFEVNPEDAVSLNTSQRIDIGLQLLERLTPYAQIPGLDGQPLVNLQAALEEALKFIPGYNYRRVMGGQPGQQGQQAQPTQQRLGPNGLEPTNV